MTKTKNRVQFSLAIEAMMLSCTIGTKENRYVVVSDIPRAFLRTDMEDNIHMLLEGTVTEMIVKLDSTVYRKTYVTTNMETHAI